MRRRFGGRARQTDKWSYAPNECEAHGPFVALAAASVVSPVSLKYKFVASANRRNLVTGSAEGEDHESYRSCRVVPRQYPICPRILTTDLRNAAGTTAVHAAADVVDEVIAESGAEGRTGGRHALPARARLAPSGLIVRCRSPKQDLRPDDTSAAISSAGNVAPWRQGRSSF